MESHHRQWMGLELFSHDQICIILATQKLKLIKWTGGGVTH